MDEQKHWLIAARAPGLHADTLAKLVERFGSLSEACATTADALIAAGIGDKAARRISQPDLAQLDVDRRWLDDPGCAFVPYTSSAYPPLLKELRGAPIGLFVRGRIEALREPQLAMVGSRNPTAVGRETAHAFAAHLARCGLAITSGLAIGIDAASHEGALHAGGVTLAVCATGLDSIYPRANEKLADAICERGALVSQFPPNTPMAKHLFPLRNRLISGFSLGTLVVEAAVHSGSLITARFAAEQGREVFAIPGSIHNTLARGCHQLIRQGAKLVESAEDILSELGPLTATLTADKQRGSSTELAETTTISGSLLDKDYKILLDALGFDPVGVDQLVARTGLRTDAIASMLLILELEGHIESQPGGLYVRTHTTAKTKP